MRKRDILDDIDALIDGQLDAGEPENGYDFGDPTYPECRCGRDWHGLPITADMESMRRIGWLDPTYTYAEDSSAILCPGSDVEGPLRDCGDVDAEHLPLGAGASIRRVTLGAYTFQEFFIPLDAEDGDDLTDAVRRTLDYVRETLEGILSVSADSDNDDDGG